MRNIFVAVVFALIGACGVEHPAVGVDTDGAPPPTEGRVLVSAVVDGYDSNVLLAMVSPVGSPWAPYGAFCAMMTDHYSVSGAATQEFTSLNNGPCDLNGVDLVLDNGNYEVGFYVFVPGEQTPTRSVLVPFTLYGDTTVVAPPLADWN